MHSSVTPLQSKVIHFLQQDAGFEKTPEVNIFFNNSGCHITYVGAATSISAFGANAVNAYQEFIDKWDSYKQGRQ